MTRACRTLLDGSLLLLFSVLLTTAGCNAAEPSDQPAPGKQQSGIIGGTIETGHSAVHRIEVTESTDGHYDCTATLIGPRSVLTAAHCMFMQKSPWTRLTSGTVFIAGYQYPFTSSDVHPDYKGQVQADLAVIHLSQDVTGVTPVPVTGQPPLPSEPIQFVGYGSSTCGGSDFGTKRIGSNVIDSIAPEFFQVAASTAHPAITGAGDSGGPALAVRAGKEVQIGVFSKDNCTAALATRLDVYRQWIAAQAGLPAVQAPSVKITSPLDKAEVLASFQVTVQATAEEDVARVELKAGSTTCTLQAGTTYQFDCNATGLGSLVLGVTAFDRAGNSGTASLTVNVVKQLSDAGSTSDGASVGLEPTAAQSSGCSISAASRPVFWPLGLLLPLLLARRVLVRRRRGTGN